MAKTLDLIDVGDGARLGSVTLDKGKLTFDGDLPEKIMHNALNRSGQTPESVFEMYRSYSNGYLKFQAKGGE